MKKRVLLLYLLFLVACANDTDQSAADLEQLSGQELSKIYCSSCHLYNAPETLPKSAWENVLPQMGHRLGIATNRFAPYKGKLMEEEFRLRQAGIFPQEQALSDTAWQKIVDYYLAQAPDSLLLPAQQTWQLNELFEVRPYTITEKQAAAITMVKVAAQQKQLMVGDVNGLVAIYDENMAPLATTTCASPIVDATYSIDRSEWLLQEIGLLSPNDLLTSSISSFDPTTNVPVSKILESLPRSVALATIRSAATDEEQIIVCGFGHELGQLLLLQSTEKGYQKQVLKNSPGALKAAVFDADEDGDEDVMVLFGQGDEGISIFLNDNGQFKEQRVLRFSSVNGSSDFELQDFDGDGDQDIIYVNGDNGDYSYCLKPHHGVHVYINNGNFEFEEQYFFQLYGASKVRAFDYDLDGDMDIFAAAFYIDFQATERSLVYLENQGDMTFIPQSIPIASDGRWMVMDAGDLDADGDSDVVLGSFLLDEPIIPTALKIQWAASTTQVVILENRTF